jgi:hypothetical protein
MPLFGWVEEGEGEAAANRKTDHRSQSADAGLRIEEQFEEAVGG